MARPRGIIPDKQHAELVAARDARAKLLAATEAAEERFKRAVQEAIRAGGSYTMVAETAEIAKSTVQKYAGPS